MLGNLISPKIGIALVTSEIKKSLKQPIKDYDIILDCEQNKIDFAVYNYVEPDKSITTKKMFKYEDGEKIANYIKHQIKNDVSKKDTLTKVVITVREKINIYIGYIDEKGNKQFNQKELK